MPLLPGRYCYGLRPTNVLGRDGRPLSVHPAVYDYLYYKLVKRRKRGKQGYGNIKVPLELKMLWIAKKCQVSYDVVRWTINVLVRTGQIERFTVKLGGREVKSISRYRWVTE